MESGNREFSYAGLWQGLEGRGEADYDYSLHCHGYRPPAIGYGPYRQ